MLKYKMILEAIDRVTGPAKRIRASMKGIGGAARTMAADLRKVGGEMSSVTRLDRGVMHLGRAFTATGRAAKRWAGKAGIGSWGDAAELAGRGVGSLIRKLGGLAASTLKWGAAAAGAGAGFALFDLFGTASQFEQFQIMLEGIEGSASAAKRSFAWVKEFAQTTPYELADVMAAFVQLKAYGIDPMDGSLLSLGDAAAGMNKPIMQAVEAMADAMTGEFERLKEFGIRAKVQGDKVTFSYTKNGKDIRREAKNTGAEVEKALSGIFGERFGGMMDRQSRTLAGMLSNLKDQWSNFLMMVADAGIFDLVKSKIQAVLDKVNVWAKDGTLKAWAEKVSKWLEDAFKWGVKFVEETDWNKVVTDLQSIAEAAKATASAINSIRWFFSESAMEKKINNSLWGESSWEKRINESLWGSGRPSAPAPAAKRPPAAWPKAPAALPGWAAPRKTSAADVKVGGRAVVDVRVTGPATARVSSIDNGRSAVPLQVNLGKTMAGAA